MKSEIKSFSWHKMTTEVCEVYVVSGDENCMFAAIGHQMFGYDIQSTMHRTMTITLREKVVEYVRNNRSDPIVQAQVTARIADEYPGQQGPTDEQPVLNFSHQLAQDGTWGDEETLSAISKLFRTRIGILREHGTHMTIAHGNATDERMIRQVYSGKLTD
ncbi:hypothetical protein Bhyg_08573 [Pseudolycoriella hygida]|uniref:OTU domain-containing protein n=1 Tax=Pseudolycoriella hygida TaxID=35572 RepID=A0A9Q0N515_9DIPT|nr:hypothetical protein Bhyg_08573 [Pseudolycoriella hygida]